MAIGNIDETRSDSKLSAARAHTVQSIFAQWLTARGREESASSAQDGADDGEYDRLEAERDAASDDYWVAVDAMTRTASDTHFEIQDKITVYKWMVAMGEPVAYRDKLLLESIEADLDSVSYADAKRGGVVLPRGFIADNPAAAIDPASRFGAAWVAFLEADGEYQRMSEAQPDAAPKVIEPLFQKRVEAMDRCVAEPAHSQIEMICKLWIVAMDHEHGTPGFATAADFYACLAAEVARFVELPPAGR